MTPEQQLKSRERHRLDYLKHRDKRRASAKARRIRDREKIRARNREYTRLNPDKHREWKRRWNNANRWRLKSYDSKRRALKLSTTTDTDRVREFYSWIANQDFVNCTYCGVFMSGKSVQIDHIVPLTRRGAHDPDNFCVACRTCNASKHNRLLSEWPKCPEKFRFIQV